MIPIGCGAAATQLGNHEQRDGSRHFSTHFPSLCTSDTARMESGMLYWSSCTAKLPQSRSQMRILLLEVMVASSLSCRSS